MNFLFGFITVLSTLFSEPDSNGWVAVERSPQVNSFEHAGDEDDPSIWVVFSKQMEGERFMVRFPKDPKYTYPSANEMEMTAAEGGAVYRLTVLQGSIETLDERAKELALQPEILLVESTRTSVNTFDLLYNQEGKWVWEHLHLTPHHLYIFQTKKDVLQGDGHRYFYQSLDTSEK